MNTFIFDLDGTLLPMPDQQLFLDTYLNALKIKIAAHGIEPHMIIQAIWVATGAMLKNDGSRTNEQRFWEVFENMVGEDARGLEQVFEHFYRNEFVVAKDTTSTHPNAMECIKALKEKNYQVVLATNPVFPRIATLTRMEWAGLDPMDFCLITTYENSSYCKPNLEYYKGILDNINKQANDCIMIGNDVKEDMCAAHLGMDTFLLKDCIICPEDMDMKDYRYGDFDDLLNIIKGLPSLT